MSKTENENENIMAVCKVMHDNSIGCVVIVKIQNKEKIPVGIITERYHKYFGQTEYRF